MSRYDPKFGYVQGNPSRQPSSSSMAGDSSTAGAMKSNQWTQPARPKGEWIPWKGNKILRWNPEKNKFQTYRRPDGYRPVRRTLDERRSMFFNWYSKLPDAAQKRALESDWMKKHFPGWTGFGTEGSGVSGFDCCGMGDAGPVVEAAAARWMKAGDCQKFLDMVETYTRLSNKTGKSKATRENAAQYAAGCRAYYNQCVARKTAQVPSGGFCVDAQGVSVPCVEQPHGGIVAHGALAPNGQPVYRVVDTGALFYYDPTSGQPVYQDAFGQWPVTPVTPEFMSEEGSTSPQGGTVYRVLSTNQRFFIDAATGQRIYQNADGTWETSTTTPVVPAGLAPTGKTSPAGQPIYFNPATGQSLYFGSTGQPVYFNPSTGEFDITSGLLPTPTLPQPVTPIPESPVPESPVSTGTSWLSGKNMLIVGAVAIGAYVYWKKRKP